MHGFASASGSLRRWPVNHPATHLLCAKPGSVSVGGRNRLFFDGDRGRDSLKDKAPLDTNRAKYPEIRDYACTELGKLGIW